VSSAETLIAEMSLSHRSAPLREVWKNSAFVSLQAEKSRAGVLQSEKAASASRQPLKRQLSSFAELKFAPCMALSANKTLIIDAPVKSAPDAFAALISQRLKNASPKRQPENSQREKTQSVKAAREKSEPVKRQPSNRQRVSERGEKTGAGFKLQWEARFGDILHNNTCYFVIYY
jgi:hypothetical protein